MSRERGSRGAAGPRLVLLWGLAAVAVPPAGAQNVAAPAPAVVPAPAAAPVVVGEGPVAVAEAIPPEVQPVRFRIPEGVTIEILGPAPEPIPVAPGTEATTFGLRVGQAYRLRLGNLPNHPGAELFPIVELVGHLHRPRSIDPLKYPIRVQIGQEDLDDAVLRGRLVTQVVYLEDPEQALPLSLPKDEIAMVTLDPSESPRKVASALGRPVVVVTLGGRVPSPEDLAGPAGDGLACGRCAFAGPDGGRCPLPCLPMTSPPTPQSRPWLPRDEFLCDGGDRGAPAAIPPGATPLGIGGVDPRDAVVRFVEPHGTHVLPTNVVCLYAPRFAAVRASIGPDQAKTIVTPAGAEIAEAPALSLTRQRFDRLERTQAAEANRHRARPSGLVNTALPFEQIELRILNQFHGVTHVAGHVALQKEATAANLQKAVQTRLTLKPEGIKVAESAVVTGIVQGAAERVMSWKPQEVAGVEVPPARPGLAVVKRVSAAEAEPGDVVTFVIQFRNMGNTPITSVSIVDSLMPRLEYVPGSAQGPPGTVFTAGSNAAASTELRWDLPGAIAPGVEGSVSFQARVR